MSVAEPSALALYFVITATDATRYDAFLDINDYDGFSTFDVRYRLEGSDDEWAFLSPTHHPEGGFSVEISEEKLTDKESTNAEVDRILNGFNKIIATVFGASVGEEPTSGMERVRWLLKNGIEAQGNELKRVK